MAKVFDLDKLKTKQPLKAEQPRARGRKPTRNPFVLVPWEWIEQAARLTRSPATLVLMELLYASWRARSPTFPLPNARLKHLGVSRDVKSWVLLDLECGRVIAVRRSPRKTPVITLVGVPNLSANDDSSVGK